ncbi:MAG: TRAP transporter small permease, partial [Rhodospirillales bacterium]|nr:TRAP transporter small permease [Rhodospirillales bacterium]
MGRGRVERLIDAIELTAAVFLAVVTALTFVSVFLRYLFAWSIPDAYDFGSLLLGVLIFWGIAGASYRGEHITVDLLWGVAPPAIRRVMDGFADALTLACLAVFAWMMGVKVLSTYADNVRTFDLRLPVWLFHFLAWVGLATAVALLATRLARRAL